MGIKKVILFIIFPMITSCIGEVNYKIPPPEIKNNKFLIKTITEDSKLSSEILPLTKDDSNKSSFSSVLRIHYRVNKVLIKENFLFFSYEKDSLFHMDVINLDSLVKEGTWYSKYKIIDFALKSKSEIYFLFNSPSGSSVILENVLDYKEDNFTVSEFNTPPSFKIIYSNDLVILSNDAKSYFYNLENTFLREEAGVSSYIKSKGITIKEGPSVLIKNEKKTIDLGEKNPVRQNNLLISSSDKLKVTEIGKSLDEPTLSEVISEIGLSFLNFSYNTNEVFGIQSNKIYNLILNDNFLNKETILYENDQREILSYFKVGENTQKKLIVRNKGFLDILAKEEPIEYGNSIEFLGLKSSSSPQEIFVFKNSTLISKVKLEDVSKIHKVTSSLKKGDVIDIVSVGIGKSYLSFLKVNNHFCYNELENDLSLSNYQGISYKDGKCLSKLFEPLCNPNEKIEPQITCSLPLNKEGKIHCDNSGFDYYCKDENKCANGFVYSSGLCLLKICDPNEKIDCSSTSERREKTCSSLGDSISSCDFVECKEGFLDVLGECRPVICNSGEKSSCFIPNAKGEKTCLNSTEYSSCEVASCDSGFFQSENSCLPEVCTPNSESACIIDNFIGTKSCNSNGSAESSCVHSAECRDGYYFDSGSCLPEICSPNTTAPCSDNSGSGIMTCSALGDSFSSCEMNYCNSGFYLDSGVCHPQVCTALSTTDCSILNGQGIKSCNLQGSGYGECSLISCDEGYTKVEEACVPQVCTPSESIFCSSGNGTGLKTCSLDGLSTSPCAISACDSGYYLSGGSCHPQSCIPNEVRDCSLDNFKGIQSCSANGSHWESCTKTTECEMGYYKDGDVCSPQICTPNSNYTCSIPNATASKTCDSMGSSFGSCIIESCDPGYYNNLNSCHVQQCTPNSEESCFVQHGIGGMTCNAEGSSFGLCEIKSCNTGYHLEGESCVSDTKSCFIQDGIGIQLYSDGWGSCNVQSCNPGFYKDGGSCSPQICTPSSISECTTTDGHNGEMICSEIGNEFGSCEFKSCKEGTHLESGSCVPNTRSCFVLNGIGSQEWNGSSWGICTAQSCDPDFHIEDNSCVNDTRICSIANGLGTQSWNGIFYGTCNAESCASGYHIEDNMCLPDIKSCTIPNGSGTQSWDSGSYSACVPSSCNSGYHIEDNMCLSDIKSCSLPRGIGYSTWDGNSYGVCIANSCQDGYHVSSGSCEINLRICGNGKVQQWDGSSWGSCSAACSGGKVLHGIDPETATPICEDNCLLGLFKINLFGIMVCL